MLRNSLRLFIVSALAGALFIGVVAAQETIKVGLVMPLTGVLGPVGIQAVAVARLYMAQHGNMVAGRKIEVLTFAAEGEEIELTEHGGGRALVVDGAQTFGSVP